MDGYKDYIIEVSNFPEKGVSFKDISPLLEDQETFRSAIVDMGGFSDDNLPDHWVGIDARGFIFASALATYFGGGIVMCRKRGKLPPPTIDSKYTTEYSDDELSIKKVLHRDNGDGTFTNNGNKVVIVDDVLATGGTLLNANNLCKEAGYDVLGVTTLIDLKYVPRVDNFNLNINSVITYE